MGTIRKKKNFISLILINYGISNPLKCKILTAAKLNRFTVICVMLGNLPAIKTCFTNLCA